MSRKQCMIDKARLNGRYLIHAYATGLIRGITLGSYLTTEEKLQEIISTLEDLDEVAYDDSLPWDTGNYTVLPMSAEGNVRSNFSINEGDVVNANC